MASSLPVQRLAGDAVWARVARQARCADSGLDPDQWYPVSTGPSRARHEASAAIADRAHLRRRWPAGHRGRRRTAGSGMIVRPPLSPVPSGLVRGGDVR
jgi:hypothetical protein